MAGYTGQEITWEKAMKSKRTFMLPRYAWDAEPPVKPGRRRPIPHGHAGNHPVSCNFRQDLSRFSSGAWGEGVLAGRAE